VWSTKKENGIAHKKQNCPQKEKKRTVEILQFPIRNRYDGFKVKERKEKSIANSCYLRALFKLRSN
jgi:hypothetical protein